MEGLWNFNGSFIEKILDWNVEKLWNICGESQIWRIYEKPIRWKITDWKNQRRAKINAQALREWSGTRNQAEGLNMLRKIADWASTESGKEVLTGILWGFVGIIAVRMFCFLVCVATGYPANIWNIFG